MNSVIIIGGGIVGLATAWKLALRFPDAQLTILEKESDVGRHQSGNNSGVLHCGLYYKPGSLKAKLAVSGIREMVEFCLSNGIAHEICGKLVVATSPSEIHRLEDLEKRAVANGLRGVTRLQKEEMREREPHVGGLAALLVPDEGIVNYREVCRVLKQKLADQGHSVICGARATRLIAKERGWRVEADNGFARECDFLVNCSGLHSDRVCRMSGARAEHQIVPFRGEYYRLKPEKQSLVRHLLYPVPDPVFPFLGVHFSRLIQGGVEAGPNAVLALSREGYRRSDILMGDVLSTLTYPGLWRFIARHPRMCMHELWQSLVKSAFCSSLQKLVPEISEDDLGVGGSGVRAQAMSMDGTLVQDFSLVEERRALHVLKAPSPAATASLAIGGELVGRICRQIGADERMN